MSAITVAPRLRCKRPVVYRKPAPKRMEQRIFRTIVEMAYEMEASERVCPVEYEEGMAWLKDNLFAVKKSVARHLRIREPHLMFYPKAYSPFNNGYTASYVKTMTGETVLVHRGYNYHTPLYNAVSHHTIRVRLEEGKAFLVVKGYYWCSAMERDGVTKEIILPLSESLSMIERSVVKMLRSINPFPSIVFP